MSMNDFMSKLNSPVEEDENEDHYRAWRHFKGGKEVRLQIRYKVAHHFTLPYTAIQLVQYIGPSKLSIFCNHFIIHITGENLDELDFLLQDEKVRYIQTFNAKHFKNELAANEGKVTDITIEWLRKHMEPEEEGN